jgi:hypothetical protein
MHKEGKTWEKAEKEVREDKNRISCLITYMKEE